MRRRRLTYLRALRFRWLTPFYDVALAVVLRDAALKDRLVRLAGFQPGERILDLGCGTATLDRLIAERHGGLTIAGVDADRAMLALARKQTAAYRSLVLLCEGYVESLPFADGAFDHVVSSLMFHHLRGPAKARALGESFRVLKLGGRLHILDWGRPATRWDGLRALPVRLFDGLDVTRDNLEGRLPALMHEAGFGDAVELATANTLLGTLTFYAGTKPVAVG